MLDIHKTRDETRCPKGGGVCYEYIPCEFKTQFLTSNSKDFDTWIREMIKY